MLFFTIERIQRNGKRTHIPNPRINLRARYKHCSSIGFKDFKTFSLMLRLHRTKFKM